MKPAHIAIFVISAVVSALLLLNIWARQPGSILKKVLWSLVVCVPFAGWLFYGAFYSPPGGNTIEAEGKASGWKPNWPANW